MMLRTLTAPSSSMSFRIAYKRSGENCGDVSLSCDKNHLVGFHIPRSTTCTATRPI
jgi:hypothetical protein